MDFEKNVLECLRGIFNEIKYNQKFKHRKTYLFDYVYREIFGNRLLDNIKELKKISKELCDIKGKI